MSKKEASKSVPYKIITKKIPSSRFALSSCTFQNQVNRMQKIFYK